MKKLSIIAAIAVFVLACSIQIPPKVESQPPSSSTLEPAAIPTVQPTVQENVKPKAGATFSGPIQITGEHASSGTLTFTISADGNAITFVTLGLTNVKCTGISIGEATMTINTTEPITDKLNFSVNGIGDIQGRFDSPTSASGTIHLKVVLGMVSSSVCDMGTWDWSATAD